MIELKILEERQNKLSKNSTRVPDHKRSSNDVLPPLKVKNK
jgi:hypothetical protein